MLHEISTTYTNTSLAPGGKNVFVLYRLQTSLILCRVLEAALKMAVIF